MFKRLTLRLRAPFSRLLDRAEDPVELLDYSYERHVEQLYGMRRDIADLVTAKKRVVQQRDRRRDQVRKLHAGARKALELGHEDLARQALERERLVGQELVGLSQLISDLEVQQAQMVAHGREYRSRIARFRSHTEVSKAQYAAAKAQVAISEAVIGLSSQLREVTGRIERAMEKAEELNVRASVIEELEGSGVLGAIGAGEDDIDRQLRELSSGGSIDAELARMKLEIDRGKASGPRG
jgi:phage shock protein A